MTTRVYPEALADKVYVASVTAGLRLPATITGAPPDGDRTWTWTPDLTTAEQTTLNDLQTMLGFGIAASITLAEFQAIKADLATAKAFLGIASPTAAQSNAALKSTIRVIGALLRS